MDRQVGRQNDYTVEIQGGVVTDMEGNIELRR